MLKAPNLSRFDWLVHGFGFRDSEYPPSVTTLRQIHSNIVIEACPPGGDRIAEGDALISREPGMIVGIRTADCIPVLIVDSRARAVAAVHAGWRGTAGGIVASTVNELITRYGARAEDLHAAIGPGIGPCCYEVSPDVAHRFGAWAPHLRQSAAPVRIDLPSINECQLRTAGVQDVWYAGECTFCEAERYFSFRREKDRAGRMLSFAGIKK
ncbi:MAG TPA: peptidoglycan editing factor PgeF [Bryobacteraceae bacterium]|nr:peptidoglycan editing factor PgeF [Bryobacteraceae bacterium]